MSNSSSTSLLKSVRAIDSLVCMTHCVTIQSCSFIILDSITQKCRIYLSFLTANNSLIQVSSKGTSIYIKNEFDMINMNLIHHWTFNGHLTDVTSGVTLYNPKSVSFTTDRSNKANSALKLGNLRLPDGTYIYQEFTFALWIKLMQCVGCDR